MTEDWKQKLAKGFNRPMPSEEHSSSTGTIGKDLAHVKEDNYAQNGHRSYGPNEHLPLYKSLRLAYSDALRMNSSANTGLLFDKFCNHWSGPPSWKERIIDNREKQKMQEAKSDKTWDQNPRTWFLKAVANHSNSHNLSPGMLESAHSRLTNLIDGLGGSSETLRTSWRFVSGLGMGHVLETGFVWHRILGVPFLPGSSIKGIIRAWAEKWEDGYDRDKINRLFGDSDENGVGRLIVFDALPLRRPELEIDVMNPHYGDYYSKKKKNGKPVPPADYLSPNPIFFLSVSHGVSFKFYLAPRPGAGSKDDLREGFSLLKNALENIGAGGKTAVGYGYFEME